eukprot:g709.t1
MISLYAELGEWSTISSNESLNSLYDVLAVATDLVASCSKHYSIIGFLRANELRDKFIQWSESIAEALTEFADCKQFEAEDLNKEFQIEISALNDQLNEISFIDDEMNKQCTLAQSLFNSLDSLTKSSMYSTVIKELEDLIKESNFNAKDLTDVRDLYDSTPEWLENSVLKEEYLVFLQMAIAKSTKGKQECNPFLMNRIPETPDSFKCSITNELMKDPVVNMSTGIIFDRENINNWIKTNGQICPVTGNTIPSDESRLIPLPSLKKDIAEFMTKHGLQSPVPNTAPSHATSSLFASSPVSFSFGSHPFGVNPASHTMFGGSLAQPSTAFTSPPWGRSLFASVPPLSLTPPRVASERRQDEVNEQFMTITTRREFQHLDLEQLRHHDYAQRGFHGMNVAALRSSIIHSRAEGETRHFSNGIQFPRWSSTAVQTTQSAFGMNNNSFQSQAPTFSQGSVLSTGTLNFTSTAAMSQPPNASQAGTGDAADFHTNGYNPPTPSLPPQ